MLLFLDGQAHYDAAHLSAKYSTVGTVGCTWEVVPEGRYGNCIRRVSTNNAGDAGALTIAPLTTRLGPWVQTTGGVCGFALKVDDLTRGSDAVELRRFSTGLLNIAEGAGWHLKLLVNPNGTFTLLRGGDTFTGGDILLAQSIEGLTSATWMFVECKWLLHDTTGSCDVRVNGLTVLSYAGNTRAQPIAFPSLGVWNAVQVGGMAADNGAPWLTLRICDLYLADLAGSGDDVRDFLGDGVIETILPDGVGASTGWTPSSGPNWDTVNDSPAPDGDATTIEATTPGTRDTYTYTDLPGGALVKGAQVCILARKLEEGSASIAPVVRQGSTDYVGPTQGVASPAYDRYVTQAYDLNPATGVKFTAAEINAGLFGVAKVT